jgi:hypothetical protein
MALTISVVKKNVVGAQREIIADVTFDNSYPTGGEAFDPTDLDPLAAETDVFHFVVVEMNEATIADMRHVFYDYTNEKLIVNTAINTEATNASDQSAVKVRVLGRYGSVSG